MAIGQVNLNEIVYSIREPIGPLILKRLEQILPGYDDLITRKELETIQKEVDSRWDDLLKEEGKEGAP